MSDGSDQNPNRAPWTTPGGAGDPMNNPASGPYAPHEAAAGQREPKKGLGCWVWGCLGAIVFMLLAMVGLGVGGYYLLTTQVAKYTDTQAAEMPVVEMDEEELSALETRIESFTNQVRGEQSVNVGEDVDVDADGESDTDSEEVATDQLPVRELELTAKEINGLIASKPELKGRVFVEIEDGRVFGKVSIPTDMFPGGDGRFFNADGEFDVSMQDGILVVRLIDASVKGEQIPQQILDQFALENLAKDVYKNPENAEMLRKFETIEVEGESIILRLREPDSTSPQEETSAEEEVEAAEEGEPVAT